VHLHLSAGLMLGAARVDPSLVVTTWSSISRPTFCNEYLEQLEWTYFLEQHEWTHLLQWLLGTAKVDSSLSVATLDENMFNFPKVFWFS